MKFLNTLSILILFLLTLTITISAQITSTGTGGIWTDGSTWVGGIVPGASDDVVIDGNVVFNSEVSCNNLTVTQNGKLNVTFNAQTHGITVNGDITNNGIIIDNDDDWYNMIIYLYGNLNNSGTIKIYQLNMQSGGQTITTVESGICSVYQLTGSIVDDIVYFAGNSNINFYTLEHITASLNFEANKTHTLGNYYDTGNNWVYDVTLIGNENTVLNFETSWTTFGLVKVVNAEIAGTYIISGSGNVLDNCTLTGTMIPGGNGVNEYVTLINDFVNLGTIQDANDKSLVIDVQGHIYNEATWDNYSLNFSTGYDIMVDCAGDYYFSPTNITFIDSNTTVTFLSDVAFTDVGEIYGNYAKPIFSEGVELSFSNLRARHLTFNIGIDNAVLIKNNAELLGCTFNGDNGNSTLKFESGGYVSQTVIKDLTLIGNVRTTYNLDMYGTVTVQDTFQNASPYNFISLIIYGSLINNGSFIMPGQNYSLSLLGDITNNGDIKCQDFWFLGTEDQTYTGAPESFLEANSIYNNDSTTVINIVGEFNLYNCNASWNNNKLIMAPNSSIHHTGMHKQFYGAQVFANGGKVKVDNTAYIRNTTFYDAELCGKFYIGGGVNIYGNSTLTDTLVAYASTQTVSSGGTFTNNGLIMDEAANNTNLFVYGNLENYGQLNNNQITFKSSQNQYFKIYNDSYPTGRVNLEVDEIISPMQWYYNDEVLPGATNYLYYIDNLSSENFGDYYCMYNSDVHGRTISIMDGNGSSLITVDVNANEGWNLISVPVLAESMNTSSLFPTATSSAFAFDNGYATTDMLGNGTGYWLKFAEEETVQIEGTEIENKEIAIVEGWNIIGPFNETYPVASLTTEPSDLLQSQFFGFESGYTTTDNLEPGKGYWIKSSGDGMITYSAKTSSTAAKVSEAYASIRFTDSDGSLQTLKLSENFTDFEAMLPPMPPTGMFDIRFENNRSISQINDIAGVVLTSVVYPLTITCSGKDIIVRSKMGTKKLANGESLVIESATSSLSIQGATIPDSYNLAQNYPNPFNPATTIEYSITDDTRVTLEVMNILGERIQLLVNEYQKSGLHTLKFNAENLPSGVYIYRLTTDKYSATKKMMLLK